MPCTGRLAASSITVHSASSWPSTTFSAKFGVLLPGKGIPLAEVNFESLVEAIEPYSVHQGVLHEGRGRAEELCVCVYVCRGEGRSYDRMPFLVVRAELSDADGPAPSLVQSNRQ